MERVNVSNQYVFICRLENIQKLDSWYNFLVHKCDRSDARRGKSFPSHNRHRTDAELCNFRKRRKPHSVKFCTYSSVVAACPKISHSIVGIIRIDLWHSDFFNC